MCVGWRGGLASLKCRFFGMVFPLALLSLPVTLASPLSSFCPFPAVLCYFNHKSFWRVIRIHPTTTVSCGNDPNSVQESLSDSNISNTTNNHKKFLNSQ